MNATDFLKQRGAVRDTDPNGYCQFDSNVKMLEEYASVLLNPVTLSDDEIRDIGKEQVSYDRQLAVCGKKSADNVLYFG